MDNHIDYIGWDQLTCPSAGSYFSVEILSLQYKAYFIGLISAELSVDDNLTLIVHSKGILKQIRVWATFTYCFENI